jgi:hypothetical protein
MEMTRELKFSPATQGGNPISRLEEMLVVEVLAETSPSH